MLTQSLPQCVRPVSHSSHLPDLQATPEGQTVPQVPQLFSSVDVSVHAPLQSVSLAFEQVHLPLVHATPDGQIAPHFPQFAVSVSVSTQVLSQVVGAVEGQSHVPSLQVAAVGQTLAQVPQWAVSVFSSTQLLPHFTSPEPQFVIVMPASTSAQKSCPDGVDSVHFPAQSLSVMYVPLMQT